ncbi:hypothetical protein CDL15_Pgr001550 [Punica granatum]|uniref:Uncharacterized protein n=1 Tax=Punica granatum TaxID=22663 RepID=A0A218X4I5_PUNGR|nr:hypothetical protein CDL15_Pgr001550 [Punica granatum]
MEDMSHEATYFIPLSSFSIYKMSKLQYALHNTPQLGQEPLTKFINTELSGSAALICKKSSNPITTNNILEENDWKKVEIYISIVKNLPP